MEAHRGHGTIALIFSDLSAHLRVKWSASLLASFLSPGPEESKYPFLKLGDSVSSTWIRTPMIGMRDYDTNHSATQIPRVIHADEQCLLNFRTYLFLQRNDWSRIRTAWLHLERCKNKPFRYSGVHVNHSKFSIAQYHHMERMHSFFI